MLSTNETRQAALKRRKRPGSRKCATLSIAIAAALLSGCTTTAETASPSTGQLTIERLLTAPLGGIAVRDEIQSALIQAYGIKDPQSKHIENQPRTLADRHVLSMFWLEPPPADFLAVAVAAEPCFPAERALQLTHAKPHTEGQAPGAKTYDASRNGMMVSFSTTPDGTCVSFIHIERDR